MLSYHMGIRSEFVTKSQELLDKKQALMDKNLKISQKDHICQELLDQVSEYPDQGQLIWTSDIFSGQGLTIIGQLFLEHQIRQEFPDRGEEILELLQIQIAEHYQYTCLRYLILMKKIKNVSINIVN
ncbi:Hypothetical_protein [Hexamita inflata]|uniref:Hypothetical_protein n=1 Tax=Hexamita inflata TaxID=28002 RepID=A0AA86QJR1_9EUKA|nr:Hypothetical protein HINF_LOCUS42009 [Hexamita inflata]